ncbi:hypothetical protein SDC9_158857 [bioreactor metagenome]|uniref:Uncharacterized protein n=1 Tax=bioreactor metagenome TaxID=1076179 RepID=A0A645FGD7_9ZZZZ
MAWDLNGRLHKVADETHRVLEHHRRRVAALRRRASRHFNDRRRAHRSRRADLHLTAADLGGEGAVFSEHPTSRARGPHRAHHVGARDFKIIEHRDDDARQNSRGTSRGSGADDALTAVHLHRRHRTRRGPRVDAAERQFSRGLRGHYILRGRS